MIVLQTSFELVRSLRAQVLPLVRKHDASLASQMQRAAQSVVLNIAEARQARGLRCHDKFSIAYGECSELKAAIQLAEVFGYIDLDATLLDRCDYVCAMLYKLSR